MSTDGLINIAATTAKEVCSRFKLETDAQGLLKDDQTPSQFLELLIEKGLYMDAIRFLAFALPSREAVGWACLCVRHAMGQDPAKITGAQLAAEKWVSDSSEENRRAAMAAAEAEGYKTAGACLGMASFFSGGSISQPGLQPVSPPANATPAMAAGAIMLAAVAEHPEKAQENYKVFLQKGIAVAQRVRRSGKTT